MTWRTSGSGTSRSVMVANKLDADGALDRLEIVHEWLGPRFPIVAFSAETGEGLETLRSAAYDLLGVLRVYTKVPGKPADRTRPFTLPIGSTVLDLAREIHRDFEHSLKSARIWGSGIFDGQAVKRDHSCTMPTSSSCMCRETVASIPPSGVGAAGPVPFAACELSPRARSQPPGRPRGKGRWERL